MNKPLLKKKKRTYKLEDLRKSDIDLLIAAASVPPEAFFCFGKAWEKLYALRLIDEDTKVTMDGILAIRSFNEQ